jgi:hypothetical protein
MSRPPLSPEDEHRRRLRTFARWFVAVADADHATRLSIEAVARTIDLGGMSKADTLAALDALDDLLAGVWDRRPDED